MTDVLVTVLMVALGVIVALIGSMWRSILAHVDRLRERLDSAEAADAEQRIDHTETTGIVESLRAQFGTFREEVNRRFKSVHTRISKVEERLEKVTNRGAA